MSFGRSLYQFLLSSSQAYAKWDLEVSTSIIKNRKKMLFLLALAAPILLVCGAEAYEAHEMLGGKSAYAPAFYTTTIFLASIAVGLAAGLITGCIGAGGGFIITPALMAAGVKGILAVGTDLFHIFAKAIMGTTVHKKLGNVSVKLAIAFLVGSGAGTFVGGAINKGLYNADPLLSEMFISTIYAVLLGFLGFYALFDFLKATRGTQADSGDAHGGSAGMTGLSVKLQSLNVPPMITFDEDLVPGGRRISGWIVAAGGVVVGMLAAIMGVGGGFVTFPMFVYVFGVSSMTTVGTDILQIIFTAGFAAVGQYAIYGYVFYTLAVGMLLGSLIGLPWFLRHVHHRRLHQPRQRPSQEARGNGSARLVTLAGEYHRRGWQRGLLGRRRLLRNLGVQQVRSQPWKAERGGLRCSFVRRKTLSAASSCWAPLPCCSSSFFSPSSTMSTTVR